MAGKRMLRAVFRRTRSALRNRKVNGNRETLEELRVLR